jgi:transglutaminase-like putative cysteine protease
VLFHIEHVTEYRFQPAVFLEPHQLRLQPRTDGSQVLRNFALAIEPEPMVLSHVLDPEGNVVACAWFREKHDRLAIVARSEVETTRENPFDYLLTPKSCRLPVGYSPGEVATLGLGRVRQQRGAGADLVYALANRLLSAQGSELIPFLSGLNLAIYEQLETIHRPEGDPWAPASTLEMRRGACRDLAVLFIDACRAVGLAARFVSGYHEGDVVAGHHELHAWAEVYLPGAGWRGYDPTLGLAVADRHVAVAASNDPCVTSPVTGTFRGSPVDAATHAEVHLRVESCEPMLV